LKEHNEKKKEMSSVVQNTSKTFSVTLFGDLILERREQDEKEKN
jgi:hypothetical protein